MTDAATLVKRASNFQEGARRIYDSQGDRADMWFLALYHFLTDVQSHLNGPAREPIAWRWRHINAASGQWHYQEQPILHHNEYLEVEPLYPAPAQTTLDRETIAQAIRAAYEADLATINGDACFEYRAADFILSSGGDK